MAAQWQIRFDDGHQQRYLPDRQAVLRYVLAIGPRSASTRFEVFAETAPVRLADGSPGGRSFSLVEVIDLPVAGERDRLAAELAALSGPGARRDRAQRPGHARAGSTDHPADAGGGPGRGARAGGLRAAVLEVVSHLVLEAVPADQRSPLFDQAADLLDEAGWGLDELYVAATDESARGALFRVLGLETRTGR